MDSVIAKLDNSVFGMLADQPPRIMICGIKTQDDVGFVNRVRPDFVCFDSHSADDADDAGLKKDLSPVIKVLGSLDDLPLISGADDARALKTDAGPDPVDIINTVKRTSPDTVVIELKKHDENEYMKAREIIKGIRSIQPELID